jgi:hypothetical protein
MKAACKTDGVKRWGFFQKIRAMGNKNRLQSVVTLEENRTRGIALVQIGERYNTGFRKRIALRLLHLKNSSPLIPTKNEKEQSDQQDCVSVEKLIL